MRDTGILIGYLAVMIAITCIHSLAVLALLLAAAIAIAGTRTIRLARRALVAIVLFNSIVTVAYVIMAGLRGTFDPWYVALVNLRVFTLTFLTFLLADTINPFRAFAFSRSLSFLLILAFSQITTFRRLFTDFRMALGSRSPRRPSRRDLYRHAAATGSFFISKGMRDATEIAQGMTSRGFFDARD